MRYLTVLLIPVLLGCTAEPSADVSRAEGERLFMENCVMCHGATGTGNGPAAAGLTTQPADLTKIADRRNGVWPMLEVMSIIDGYAKRTNPREDMPIITGLSEGPMVDFDTGNGRIVPAPARLIALANYLEDIQSPPPERFVP